jgi:hypothetical protein
MSRCIRSDHRQPQPSALRRVANELHTNHCAPAAHTQAEQTQDAMRDIGLHSDLCALVRL